MTASSIVENASRLGIGVGDAASGAIDGARSAALTAGISTELAATAAYEGAQAAADKLGRSVQQAVRNARSRGADS